ncbi:esterase/lipase family protein [Kitasatospora sp. NPDC059571]|uniref:esterase/lipase family protein n=1 Tax=Kitasatospora sp. NPDC059571 TaxID=3346871 RepID=UPI0036C51938
MAEQNIEQDFPAFTLADPIASPTPLPYPVPPADEEWQLPNGFANVYYAQGTKGVQRPVIMADGFNLGRSDLDWLYAGLDRDFPLITRMRQQGRTVILLGFEERTASILENAQAVQAAVMRTIAEQLGDARLTVGGFSMGGMITRYALAKLEMQRMDHRTGLYFSWDSPHRGGVIPIGLQAFAHFIPTLPGMTHPFAQQMDSPAARQMLWRHYDKESGEVRVDPMRTEFLAQLDRVGGWPRIPRLLALANGTGNGTGLDVPPGAIALRSTGLIGFPGTTFRTQATGRGVTVAELKRLLPPAARTITTDGFPELDGAPGGTLASYQIVADALKKSGGTADLRHPEICFVPSVSAVAIRDIDKQDDLYAEIDNLSPDQSDVDDFICSSTTTPHTAITEELGTWLLDRLPH